MNINSTLFVCIILLLISCDNSNHNLEHSVIGKWSISEIKYNNKNYTSYLYSNVLIIRDNGEISIPETFHFSKDNTASWKEHDGKICISTSNMAFNDTLKVKFIKKNANNSTSLVLESDSIYIKTYKIFELN